MGRCHRFRDLPRPSLTELCTLYELKKITYQHGILEQSPRNLRGLRVFRRGVTKDLSNMVVVAYILCSVKGKSAGMSLIGGVYLDLTFSPPLMWRLTHIKQ
jgi:hypothetical protein